MAYEISLPNGYAVSDDQARLDMTVIHGFLEDAYWARGRDRALTERSIANCIALGAYAPGGAQVGFARVMTDRAMSAHLADVFVLPGHRGHGLGKALVAAALAHPDLATVIRWTLQTDDAHGLYAGFGFTAHPRPDSQMVRITERPQGGNA
jgi:GNAT superfamily N-acetyltransferase